MQSAHSTLRYSDNPCYNECRYLIGYLGDSAAILCTAHETAGADTTMQPPHTIDLPSSVSDKAAVAGGPFAAEAAGRHECLLSTRAVLLTQDHSPARPDEAARVLAAGGTITTTPGTP